MKKKYGWIYVLPVLMILMILAFGVLGVRSAIGEQRMQQELTKLQWVTDPVLAGEYTQPFLIDELDMIKIYGQGEEGKKQSHWFSYDGRELTDEELTTLYDQRIYADTEKDLEYQGKKPNMDPESLRELFGEDLLIWTDFCDGLALLYCKDRIVCVNEEGETVFEKKARIPKRYIEGGTTETNTTMAGLNRDGFRDGLAVFTLDGCKYGVLDQEGNVVIEPVFKGKKSLQVLKDQHIGVFYERVFRIGKLCERAGGMIFD